MGASRSVILHNLPNELNVDAIPIEDTTVLVAGLELLTPTVEEGQHIRGKVKRLSGPIDIAFSVTVTLTGLSALSLPLTFGPIQVTVPSGQPEAIFDFATVLILGSSQACTGTITMSGTSAVMGDPHVVTFEYTDKLIPNIPVVNFSGLPSQTPTINEALDGSVYTRVQITRTVPNGTTDTGLTVYWSKIGYGDDDLTKWPRCGTTVFPVGTLSMDFDVEAMNVVADRTITAILQQDINSPVSYQTGNKYNFQVNIHSVSNGAENDAYTGDLWHKKQFTRNAIGAFVSKYTRNHAVIGPNFFSLATHADWISYMGDLDMVNGNGTTNWKTQTWQEYIGGPAANGPTSIEANSWLNLYNSDHIRKWWTSAADHPDAWLVINCVSMPNAHVDDKNNPPWNVMRVTDAEQVQIVDDIISGAKDDDLYLFGQRLRYQIEHINSSSRAGAVHASKVMLRVNWEWQMTTSLQFAPITGTTPLSFMDKMIGLGKAANYTEAVGIYRTMMHKWCTQVKAGYAAGWNPGTTPTATLRIALSTAMLSHKGFLMKEMIHPDGANDYDIWDMMYHANKTNSPTYLGLWSLFYTPSSSGIYRHANSLIAAEYWNLPYGTLESGPTYTMQNATTPTPAFGPVDAKDPYFSDKSFSHPPNFLTDANVESVGLYHYRYNTVTKDIYQCVSKGPLNATYLPNHTSGEYTYPDGYTWVWRYNKGRKLTLVECSELFLRDFYMMRVGTGRTSFLGSFNPTSCYEGWSKDGSPQPTWSLYNRNRNAANTADEIHDDSNASDWKRFVQMRKAMLFGKKA